MALRPAGPARLRVDGGAYWPSRQSDRPGGPHFGHMSGYATVEGTVAHYSEPGDPQGCQATLRLVGPYLLVADNQRCGGYNVTFTGVYRVKSNASGRSR